MCVYINGIKSETHPKYTRDVHGYILQQQAVSAAGSLASTVDVYVAQTDDVSHCIKCRSCVD